MPDQKSGRQPAAEMQAEMAWLGKIWTRKRERWSRKRPGKRTICLRPASWDIATRILWSNLPTPISLNPAKVPSIAANQRHPIGKIER